jgi:hypothetical protein
MHAGGDFGGRRRRRRRRTKEDNLFSTGFFTCGIFGYRNSEITIRRPHFGHLF